MRELKKTSLHSRHIAQKARMINFAGWEMPLHYGSVIQEHRAVRAAVGLFDVSHMACLEIDGQEASTFLRRLLAGDVNRLTNGRGLYTCMLNEQGGIIDDLIVYRQSDERYWMIVNAATTHKDLTWMRSVVGQRDARIEHINDASILAAQGPAAAAMFTDALPEYSAAKDLPRFGFTAIAKTRIARTGYTGEDGYELVTNSATAGQLWDRLVQHGAQPCGLGSRDTLRLEYGMCLYGQDLDEQHTPLESALGWTVHWEDEARDFIGKAALLRQPRSSRKMIGLCIQGAIMRSGARVICDVGEGQVTSGGFSPSLGVSIGLARAPRAAKSYQVEIRNKPHPAEVVKPPFIKRPEKIAKTNPLK